MLQFYFWLKSIIHRLGFMFRLWVRKYAIINSNLCFNFIFDWSIPPTWLYVSTLSRISVVHRLRKYAIINSNLCFNFIFDWSIPPTWLYVSTLSSKICYNQPESMLQLFFWHEVFHRLGFMFKNWARKYAIINSNLCFNFIFDWSIPPTWLYVSTLSSKICYNQRTSNLCFNFIFDWSIPPTWLYVSTLSSKICYNQLESMLQLYFWLKYSTGGLGFMFRLWVRKYAIINSNLCFNFIFDWSIPTTWLYVSKLSSKICYNQLESMLQLYFCQVGGILQSKIKLASTLFLTEVFHRLGFMFRLWVRKYAIINSNLCFNFIFDWSIPPTWLYVSSMLISKICYNQLESMLQLYFWLKYSNDLALCFDSEFENML